MKEYTKHEFFLNKNLAMDRSINRIVPIKKFRVKRVQRTSGLLLHKGLIDLKQYRNLIVMARSTYEDFEVAVQVITNLYEQNGMMAPSFDVV